MNSAHSFLCLCLSLLLGHATYSLAQQPAINLPTSTPNATGTASISGRVTVDGAARAGVQMLLQVAPSEFTSVSELPPPLTAVTDDEGRFAFQQVQAGQYRLQPYAPVWVNDEANDLLSQGRLLNLAPGETLTAMNFALRRGGVITGKITDEAGRPFIEERIKVFLLDAANKPARELAFPSGLMTDDRGVYRIFGLAPGRYRIAVAPGQTDRAVLGLSNERKLTYFPDAVTEAEAKLIEVQPSSVAEGIDIVVRLSATKKGWTISGRVLEADTGKPVAGLTIAYGAKLPKAGELSQVFGPTPTNSLGEFRLEGLTAGEYSLNILNMQALAGGAEFYTDPLDVTLPENDLSGVELKLKRGTTLLGRLVLEGGGDPTLLQQVTGATVLAMPELDWTNPAIANSVMSFMTSGSVRADGTLSLSGLRPGKFNLNLAPQENISLRLLRLEQNGVPIGRVEVSGATRTVSVQLVMGVASATLAGRIEVRGGSFPPGTKVYLALEPRETANAAHQFPNILVDERGRFSFQGVVPGNYNLGVAFTQLADGPPLGSSTPRQPVTLTANNRQEMVLVVDLAEKEKKQ